METHNLTTKMMAKPPKIVSNCESWVSNDRKTWGYRGLTVWTSPKLSSIDFLDDFLPACTNARPYHSLP
jgi:hypothetical protein